MPTSEALGQVMYIKTLMAWFNPFISQTHYFSWTYKTNLVSLWQLLQQKHPKRLAKICFSSTAHNAQTGTQDRFLPLHRRPLLFHMEHQNKSQVTVGFVPPNPSLWLTGKRSHHICVAWWRGRCVRVRKAPWSLFVYFLRLAILLLLKAWRRMKVRRRANLSPRRGSQDQSHATATAAALSVLFSGGLQQQRCVTFSWCWRDRESYWRAEGKHWRCWKKKTLNHACHAFLF